MLAYPKEARRSNPGHPVIRNTAFRATRYRVGGAAGHSVRSKG